jgi:hypothetical protein
MAAGCTPCLGRSDHGPLHVQRKVYRRMNGRRTLSRQVKLWLVLNAIFLLMPLGVTATEARIDFDHNATEFPLTGAHQNVACESCHLRGLFKGTAKTCSGCHAPNTWVRAMGKPAQHINTRNNCEDCHNTVIWSSINRVDHDDTLGSCSSCHNGTTATGKSATHIASNSSCESCHSTSAWNPVIKVDHTTVIGTCSSCHNGTTATGKSTTHIASSNSCESCHSTSAWNPVTRVDHSAVIGTCSFCHNGITATGKPANHIQTTAECDTCHSTVGWTPAHP